MNFNPRSREGSDNNTPKNRMEQKTIFQSTLPRRERQKYSHLFSNVGNFNPRSREGSDYMTLDGVNVSRISIHAPAKGATQILVTDKEKTTFQSTLPRRERRTTVTFTPAVAAFQSTLPRRERHTWFADYCDCIGNFNPRSREGSDFARWRKIL